MEIGGALDLQCTPVQEEQRSPARQPQFQQRPLNQGGGVLSEEAKKEIIKDHPELASKVGGIKMTKTSKENKRRKQFHHGGASYNGSMFWVQPCQDMVFLFVIPRVCFFKHEFVHHVVQLVHKALPGPQEEK